MNDSVHTPSGEQLNGQLQRILTSQIFAKAPVLSRMLRYLVDQTLANNRGELKEYAVGVAVFGRNVNFDPSTDTIVRVQARRLRSRLQAYYGGPGQFDDLRIAIPKGGYTIAFGTSIRNVPQPAASRPAEMGKSWLPVPLTRLIGREREVAEVTSLLRSEGCRLLTLTGAGGCGKTRLAIAAAAQVAGEFPGGVLFAALAPLSGEALVVHELSRVLGMRHTGDSPLLDALAEHLHFGMHAPALLVADNFEHVLSAGHALVRLLESTQFLRILVTSRAVLRVYGERQYPVLSFLAPSLDPLPPLPELSANPAVCLFIERASAADVGFALTKDNARAVAESCARLDGLPLAIELAAARAKSLAPAMLLARLKHSLRLLTGGPEGVPLRQQTLRKTIDWSFQLLTESERILFRRLSVFAGGCSAEGAEAVCNTGGDLEMEVTEALSSLAEKSLLVRIPGPIPEMRFAMLETIREYAGERLTDSGERKSVCRAHAAYFVVIAEEMASEPTRQDHERWMNLCVQEHDNIRAAFQCLVAEGNKEWVLRLAHGLFWFWREKELFTEGRSCLDTAIRMNEGSDPSPLLASALNRAASFPILGTNGHVAGYQAALRMFQQLGDERGVAIQLDMLGTTYLNAAGNLDAAAEMYQQAFQAYCKLEMHLQAAGALSNLARVANRKGDTAASRALLHQAMRGFASSGQAEGVARCFNQLGDAAAKSGSFAEAANFHLQALELFRRLEVRWGEGQTLVDLAYTAMDAREPEAAHGWLQQAAAVFSALRHNGGLAKVFEGFACLAVARDQFVRSLTLAAAAESLRSRTAVPSSYFEKDDLNRRLQTARAHCEAAAALAAHDSGWRLSAIDALAFAVGSPQSLAVAIGN